MTNKGTVSDKHSSGLSYVKLLATTRHILLTEGVELQMMDGSHVSNLLQQPCTLSPKWWQQVGVTLPWCEACCLGVRMERYPIKP